MALRAMFGRSRQAMTWTRRAARGRTTRRAFGSNEGGEGSHSDFAPKRKVTIEGDSAVNEFIEKVRDKARFRLWGGGRDDDSPVFPSKQQSINDNRVMLFMKGTPEQPQCGFSAQVVRILHAEGAKFSSANVLEDMSLREGIKTFSDWPTVPQVYIDGEFIGGCDVMTSLYQSGELEEILKEGESSS